MEFLRAVKIADKNKHLIKQQFDEQTIDEIIIHPTDSKQLKEYTALYQSTSDAQQSIIPFIHSDVEISIVLNKWSTQPMILCSLYDLKEAGFKVHEV